MRTRLARVASIVNCKWLCWLHFIKICASDLEVSNGTLHSLVVIFFTCKLFYLGKFWFLGLVPIASFHQKVLDYIRLQCQPMWPGPDFDLKRAWSFSYTVPVVRRMWGVMHLVRLIGVTTSDRSNFRTRDKDTHRHTQRVSPTVRVPRIPRVDILK